MKKSLLFFISFVVLLTSVLTVVASAESNSFIDDMFDETINTYVEYVVFLQKEGQGDLWIKEKSKDYFIVNGTPNLRFAWELKAVQKKYEYLRLDDYELEQPDYSDEEDVGLSMEEDLKELDNEELFAEELFLNDGLITYAV